MLERTSRSQLNGKFMTIYGEAKAAAWFHLGGLVVPERRSSPDRVSAAGIVSLR